MDVKRSKYLKTNASIVTCCSALTIVKSAAFSTMIKAIFTVICVENA